VTRQANNVEALRFDAGSLSLNLVATVGRRYGGRVERLGSTARLRDWLAGVGLDVRRTVTDDDLERVRRLREDLGELFRSVAAGKRPSAGAVGRVNGCASRSVPRLTTTGAGLARPAAGADPLGPVLGLVAADAIRILAGAERDDLRTCEADDCRMLYLAHGRRARRWCSSERCGNRSRVAAHRARVRA
jgi:predicted RNA-binding Zn ribbon-like protein